MVEPKEVKEVKAVEEKKEQPAKADPYAIWIENNPQVVAWDVGVYPQEDGASVIFTDPRRRPLLTVSIFLPPQIIDKLVKALQKKA
ncbi:MAG: hypothetical protein QXS81_05460, partial [Candidatus Micrarchaeaceae archaeon]